MAVKNEQQARGEVVTSFQNAPTHTVSAGGVDFAYRELGPKTGVPVVFLTHLAAVLDNWDPRVVDGIATKHRVITFDNRGVGASTGSTPDTPKQFLFFTRTPNGRRAGKEFLARLKERKDNRDKAISLKSYGAQLKAIHRWGLEQPSDLSVIRQPVLVANGESDRMVPTKNSVDLARRLPDSELVIYPDAGHGGIFQFHGQFVEKALEFLAR
jgi:pimeloyl-ACP methyl ester carboxylesterase